MKDFSRLTAVVTGAASGIGRALAERFANEGMSVVLADRDKGALDEVACSIAERGAEVLAVAVDVTDPSAVQRLADQAAVRFGAVHVLCNNAGVVRSAPIWEQPLDEVHAVMDVNFWGVIHGLRAFLPAMLAHGQDCHIVNTASFAGLAALPGEFPAYTASKFAVVGVTEALVLDLETRGHRQVGVSLLCPGGVETNIFRTEVERRRAHNIANDGNERFEHYADPNRTGRYLPVTIADVVIEAIKERRLYVIPAQDELKAIAESRLRALREGLTSLKGLPLT